MKESCPSNTFPITHARCRLGRLASVITALGLMMGPGACAFEDDAEEPWIGEERGALELMPDETPRFVDEEQANEIFGDDEEIDALAAEPDVALGATWTQWYDRDNPSGNGDYENRHLQSGVCPNPSGVECQTVGGLYLWQTGEVVSCSANDGLMCINANQPDGICNYDYKVRFLCPTCTPNSCAPWQCGNVDNGCDGTMWCGACPSCGDGICNGNETSNTCPQDCCDQPLCTPLDCGFISNGCGAWQWCGDCGGGCLMGECSNGGGCCTSDSDCGFGWCMPSIQ